MSLRRENYSPLNHQGNPMKASLFSIGIVALALSACDKEVPKPPPRPVPAMPKVAEPSVPVGGISDEDKAKAMEAAKAAAKSATGKAD